MSKISVMKKDKPTEQETVKREFSSHPLLALRAQMDHLFDDFVSDWHLPSLPRSVTQFEPFPGPFWSRGMVEVKFDISESDKMVEVTAELPGMEEKDVELTLSNGVLTIKGEKKAESETKEKDYYLSERRYGAFTRSMRLPENIDEAKVKATFDKGVLKVVVPKLAEAKAKQKKIAITKS